MTLPDGSLPMGQTWHSAANLIQCVDIGGIWVIQKNTGAAYLLKGFEAALWSWLNLGYGQPELLALVQAFGNCSGAAAQTRIDSILATWIQKGLVT